MIKAIYLDFDDTVYSHTLNGIPISAIGALKAAQRKGIRIILATGRSLQEFSTFERGGLDFDAYLFNNGQEILDRDFNIIHVAAIEGELKEKLVRCFEEKRLVVQLANVQTVFVNRHSAHYLQAQNAISSVPCKVKEYEGETFELCSIFFENETQREEIMQMSDLADITCWHTGATDIIPKGCGKGRAIEWMNEYLGIDAEQCMAIGDGENDISMIRTCAIGVAMGNSPQQVRNNADYVTSDIDADGICNALVHYEIIREGE